MNNLVAKAQLIRLLILDVDGILTNGIIYYGTPDIEMRGFHIQDGLGIKLLQKSGVQVAVISGKNSPAVVQRLKELKISHIYMGHERKLPAFHELKQKLQLEDQHIGYMGDDLPDLPILKKVGFAVTVPEAPTIIQEHAHLITTKSGGQGAVREVCEYLMQAQGNFDSMLQSYLE